MRSDAAESLPVRRRAGWRRARLAAAAGALLAGLALGTVDFWGTALALRWAGLEVATREIRAGRTVTAERVRRAGNGVVWTAERVQVSAPWRMARRGVADAEIDGWVLTVAPGDGVKADATGGGDWAGLVAGLRQAGGELRRWVGRAELRDGRVLVAGETVTVARLELRGAELEGVAELRGETVEFFVGLESGEVRLSGAGGDVTAKARVSETAVDGLIAWAGNEAKVAAVFEAGQWRTKTLVVEGRGWRVPAERAGWGGRYEDLAGDWTVRSEGDGVRVDVSASARPRVAGAPEVKVDIGGVVSAARARVERMVIEAPQGRASLSAPVEWRAGEGWKIEGEPRFAWAAELGALTDGAATGRAEGEARWTGGTAEDWRIQWTATVADAAWRGLKGARLAVRAETGAEATTVAEATLELAGGGRAEASGRYVYAGGGSLDAVRLKVDGEGEALAGAVRAVAGGRDWLDGVKTGAVVMDAKLDGARMAPDYAVTLEAGPCEAAGWVLDTVRVEAKGRGAKVERIEWRAARGEARAEGWAAGNAGEGVEGEVTLRRADGRELRSQKPFHATWADGWTVSAGLAGGAGEEFFAERDARGAAVLRIRKLDTGWLEEWRSGGRWPDLEVREAVAEGAAGADGFIDGKIRLELGWRRAGAAEVWGRVEGEAGAGGWTLRTMAAGQGGETLATGAGVVPWRVRATEGMGREPVAGGRWALRLESRPEATFWNEWAKWAGVELEGPALALTVDGEAAEPRFEAALTAARVGFKGEGLPEGGLELRDVRVEGTGGRREVVVRKLAARVDGQLLELDGRLALADGDWARLRERPFVWLRDHAEARVSLPEAPVAALARYLPTLLAPQGTLAAELKLATGARLDGSVRLAGGATRPLGSFGVLQEIDVELALEGMDVRIGRMRAMAGGQPVEIRGGARRRPGRMPEFDLGVKAERFPLVRRPGLLLRGDLDLTIKTEPEGRTRVGGEVRLRDSLFLADIRPLIAGGGGKTAAVRARPPYFSVETQPLAEWELGLRVGGESFLRMRTPVFEGTGSARFELTGTFREPRATGEFWVERGNILFPFASFAVQEGAVRLRADDPYTPRLEFRATGRRLGYDLQLELGGTADAPQLQVFSNPPLEAENVLLMVTAGAAPAEGQTGSSGTQRLAAVGAYVGRDLLRTLGLGTTDEERLTMRTGEKVSRNGRETYGFELKLNERWSLTGEYDEFDAYNAGLKRTFRPGAAEDEGGEVKRGMPEATGATERKAEAKETDEAKETEAKEPEAGR